MADSNDPLVRPLAGDLHPTQKEESMSSSLLEVLRLSHEQCERLEVAFGEELDKKPNGQKAKVVQQHRLKAFIDKMIETNDEVMAMHEDNDHQLEEELNKMREGSLSAFYSSLQTTMEYYEKFPGLVAVPNPPADVTVQVGFSGEEIFGKYLDLTTLFLKFCNLLKKHSNIEQDYLQYLERFYSFFYLPADVRRTRHYAEYLQDLWQYLLDFYRRVNPLNDIESAIVMWDKEFEEKVRKGEVAVTVSHSSTKEAQPLRLGMFNDVKELEALGMDRLKEGLEALGLKCGGTLQDRAKRLWSVRGKRPEEIPSNLKTKSGQGKKDENTVPLNEELKSPYYIAMTEHRIASLCEVMADVVSATRRHAEKQQARTFEEKQQEIREEEYGLLPDAPTTGKADNNQDDDDDDAPIYNPLNLPLGWDGKPIPVWLYKLHGLGVEYKCEVCGNQSYWGRKAFDRHFQEWKHAHGMRCLGIPNTKHFHDITRIEDVVALYHKIKDQLKKEQYEADYEEEFEDTHGNVLNRRTYEDLARQGLL